MLDMRSMEGSLDLETVLEAAENEGYPALQPFAQATCPPRALDSKQLLLHPGRQAMLTKRSCGCRLLQLRCQTAVMRQQ